MCNIKIGEESVLDINLNKQFCRSFCIVAFAILSIACNKKNIFDGPDFYEDNFEQHSSFEHLFSEDGKYWSYAQITLDGNKVHVDTTRSHSGKQAICFEAGPSDGSTVSKASIAKQKMAFWEGETLLVSAWYYVEGTQEANWLFLMDLEEQAAIGAGPGMRLVLVDNQVRIEYKFNQPDIVQTKGKELQFPRNQWINLKWETKLNQKNKGHVRVWQNDSLIITRDEVVTLPKDILYVQQGTKGMYSSCEFGITANGSSQKQRIWVDDIKIEKIN